nr:hypothetical protein [Streptacidiphilus albus]
MAWIVKEYQEGWSPSQLAEEAEVDESQIKRLLVESQITMRPAGRTPTALQPRKPHPSRPPVLPENLAEDADVFRSLLVTIGRKYKGMSWDDQTVALHRLRSAGVAVSFLALFSGEQYRDLRRRMVNKSELRPSDNGQVRISCPRLDCSKILELFEDNSTPMHVTASGSRCPMSGITV